MRFHLCSILSFIILATACKKTATTPPAPPPPPPPPAPTVTITTSPIKDTTLIYCHSGGTVAVSGGSLAITKRGLVWGTSSAPTIALVTKTEEAKDTFATRLYGLSPNTTYFVRAYATTSSGTTYGNELSFKTKSLPVLNGLIACYPFSGNANNFADTLYHGTVTEATLANDRFNTANAAYAFNGTNASINFGNNPNVGPTQNIPLSISLWISANATGNVISKYTNLDASLSYFYFGRNTTVCSWIGNGTNPYITINQAADTEWTHYVLIGAAGTNNSRVYRNGKLLGTGTLALNATMRNVSLVVGRVSGAFPGFYKGLVDDVYLYNRVLTEDEITQLYNHRF